MSDEHFTVDGTLIQAWASQKSFRRKDGTDDDDGIEFPLRSNARTTRISLLQTRMRGSIRRVTARSQS